ncbi:MAG TPA: M10 family metallopeptidase C-terminal domain-containing protein [Allosphingosinicella sp.]|jgi:Ca2+-binding RTX toxin-like protein
MRRFSRDTLFLNRATERLAPLYNDAEIVSFRQATKSGTGFQVPGTGISLLPTTLVLVTPDEAGNGIGVAPGNPVLGIGTPPVVGAIGTLGDQDFYQVTLVAGKTYEFGLFGKAGGPNLLPLQDSYIELYSASGVLLGSADGGASTTVNMVNSGFDAVLTFTATTSGTYYINARAFDNDPTVGGATGEGLGDYELYAKEVDPNDPNVYHPYYEGTSPLYAIDWGSQVNKINQSARNPDGNEGTRATGGNGVDPTGNAQGTPVYSQLLDIPALAAAQGKDITGKNVITIYFAKAGDLITSIEDPTSPGLPPVMLNVRDVQGFEKAAVLTALGEFEKVADVVYLVVTNRAHADFTYTSYIGTPGPGVSLLGSMSPPDEPDEGLAQFNSGDERWNAKNLAQGGFSFVTLIHEFGHGHGLAHPHDNGGHSGIMNGVETEGAGVADYTTGDFNLNQGVFTMMSYEDGWQSSPYGNAATDAGYGYLGGLMAFDIAAIQDKYGVNEEWATGNDTYILKDENAPGTYFSSIWDGGGIDTITYSGSRDTTIDLRQATLKYEEGGGGFMSFAYGIYGGFTIANGVTIENATSGSGADTLWGNDADNVMNSGVGNDRIIFLGGGNDTAIAGDGDDFIYFGGGMTAADKVDGGAGRDEVAFLGDYRSGLTFGADSLVGVDQLAFLTGTYLGTTLFDYKITLNAANVGSAGLFVTGATLVAGETFTFDASAVMNGSITLLSGAGNDVLSGGGMGDYLKGGAGNDQMNGLGGVDTLVGGLGADQLRGGAGNDFFWYENVAESAGLSIDTILDFTAGDRIGLTALDANSTAGGNQAFSFIGSAAFTGAGQVRATYDANTNLWTVSGDIDGDGTADFQINVMRTDNGPMVASDFLL